MGKEARLRLLAAAKEKRVAAVVLASASSVSGAELNVYQVTRAMQQLGQERFRRINRRTIRPPEEDSVGGHERQRLGQSPGRHQTSG